MEYEREKEHALKNSNFQKASSLFYEKKNPGTAPAAAPRRMMNQSLLESSSISQPAAAELASENKSSVEGRQTSLAVPKTYRLMSSRGDYAVSRSPSVGYNYV